MVKGLKTQSLTINLLLRQQWTVYLSHVFSKLSACFVLALKVQIHNIERKKKTVVRCAWNYMYILTWKYHWRGEIYFLLERKMFITLYLFYYRRSLIKQDSWWWRSQVLLCMLADESAGLVLKLYVPTILAWNWSSYRVYGHVCIVVFKRGNLMHIVGFGHTKCCAGAVNYPNTVFHGPLAAVEQL